MEWSGGPTERLQGHQAPGRTAQHVFFETTLQTCRTRHPHEYVSALSPLSDLLSDALEDEQQGWEACLVRRSHWDLRFESYGVWRFLSSHCLDDLAGGMSEYLA